MPFPYLIYVGNLNVHITRDHLFALFSPFGSIVQLRMLSPLIDNLSSTMTTLSTVSVEKKRMRNAAFIEFENEQSAAKAATEMANKIILSRPLVCRVVHEEHLAVKDVGPIAPANLTVSEKIEAIRLKLSEMEEKQMKEMSAARHLSVGKLLHVDVERSPSPVKKSRKMHSPERKQRTPSPARKRRSYTPDRKRRAPSPSRSKRSAEERRR